MTNRLFITRTIGGVGVAIALAAIFSMGNAFAQMMQMPQQHQQGSTTMMIVHSMFSPHGMSMVEDEE